MGFVLCTLPDGMKQCKNLPANMLVDYVRLYQDPDDASHTLHCSPGAFPTADYITAHPNLYRNWAPFPEESSRRYWLFVMAVRALLGIAAVVTAVTCQRLSSCTLTSDRNRHAYTPLPDSKGGGSGEADAFSSSIELAEAR